MMSATLLAIFVLAQELIPSEESLESLFKELSSYLIVQAIFTVLIAYGILLSIRSFVHAISENAPRKYRLIIKQWVPFLKGLVLLITAVHLLNIFLNLTGPNLLALTGTLVVALGFAFKDYASSIIAGVVTLFEGPFRMGDRIQIGEHYGEVIDYGLRELRLQTPDDNTVAIPHNLAWTSPISNSNSGNLEAQIVTDFYFAHDADIELASDILYQAAYSSRYTQLKLPIQVVILEEPWGVHMRLKSYPMDARDEFIYKTDLLVRAKRACARHEIPFPGVSALAEAEPF